MRKENSRSSELKAGYARVDITPGPGSSLSGRPSLRPRLARSVRDPLYARALFLHCGAGRLAIVAADLLLVTKRMHEAVARTGSRQGNAKKTTGA